MSRVENGDGRNHRLQEKVTFLFNNLQVTEQLHSQETLSVVETHVQQAIRDAGPRSARREIREEGDTPQHNVARTEDVPAAPEDHAAMVAAACVSTEIPEFVQATQCFGGALQPGRAGFGGG